ncbi:MAG: acylphosphatase [Parcubacteria group bacterium]|nr:acylphosphatase [Parcubacteria group bacterium]|tara:strand:- start:2084 stop:2359 length:276 start_codon:yes stop_codon:yes gene_type:complete
MSKRLTLKIHGLVHGVGYRYSSQSMAKKKGYIGYVTNLDDGTVELVAEGKERSLKQFVNWCYNGVGPAIVHKIDQSWSEATGEFSDFVIKS